MTIVDASVAIKWFIQEPKRDRALAVLASLLEQPRRYACPALLWYELTHVLTRVTQQSEPAIRRVGRLMNTGIIVCAPTPERVASAQRIAVTNGLSGYDAAYVALAEEFNGVWLTCDARAARRVKPSHLVQLLA